MCAVSDAGHLAVLLAGLVQTLVTVDVDQGQLLHHRETDGGQEHVRIVVKYTFLNSVFDPFNNIDELRRRGAL